MWNKQSIANKKKLAIICCFCVVILAYHLSFKQTIKVITLHLQLKNQSTSDDNLAFSYPSLIRKSSYLEKALSKYMIREQDREIQIWQSISTIAIKKNLEISMSPELEELSDTIKFDKKIIQNRFQINGNYFNCIALLDSLSNTTGVGVISSASLSRSTKKNDEVDLALVLKGIERP